MLPKDIPEEVEALILKPLLQIESTDLNLMQKNLEEFLKKDVSKEINKYIKIIENNLDWFLDLEAKSKFEESLYKSYPTNAKIYFRKYNLILTFLCKTILEKSDPENIELIDRVNDLLLESDRRRRYYYNIKFYHYKESIIALKENIVKIVNKILRLETVERKHELGLTLPRWSDFQYSLDSGIFFKIDFIENKLIVNHNNVYISTIFIKDEKRKNFWRFGPLKLIEFIKQIIKEIIQNNNMTMISLYDIPNDIASELGAITSKLSNNTIMEKSKEDILGIEEGQTIEYKETFRWDTKSQNKNKKLKEEISKTVCAFLNSQGGKIFIGVNDDREVKGIESDLMLYDNANREKNKDLFTQDVRKTLISQIDSSTINLSDTYYHILDNNEIMEIRVAASTKPVFLFNEDFIVRNGNASIKLEGKQFYDYLIDHFKYGPLNNIIIGEDDEYYINKEEYQIDPPNINLINEYIEMLKNSQISDDLFSRRLDSILSEFERFRFYDWNLKDDDYETREAIETVKIFIEFALGFLKSNVSRSVKRGLLDIIYIFVNDDFLKEIVEENYFNELSALYEKKFTERILINIILKLGYFDNKLKSILIEAAQEEKIDLLNDFSSVSLSLINEDKLAIIKELHNISNQKDKETKKELTKSIERVIKNLEKGI